MNAIRLCLLTAIVALGLFVPQALAITWGEVDESNIYSNVGALVAFPPGYAPYVVGSGILIHPRVFLTAGHITMDGEQNPWVIPFSRVSFGTNAFDPSTWHETIGPITHPKYRPGSLEYDVGVIILKKPVKIGKVPLQALPPVGFLDDLLADGLLLASGHPRDAGFHRLGDRGGGPGAAIARAARRFSCLLRVVPNGTRLRRCQQRHPYAGTDPHDPPAIGRRPGQGAATTTSTAWAARARCGPCCNK